jgi:N-acetylglucosamine malate deacetylase 2
MKALLIFAHPDDETFGCGGTVAKLVKEGVTVNLITATTGQAGQTGEYGEVTPEELGKIREKEHAEAAKILGISNIHYLGLMDGQLYKHKVIELSKILLPLIEKEDPDLVITFEKNGASNHPDHKKMSLATRHAFKEYIKKAKKKTSLYHLAMPRSYLRAYEKAGLMMNAFGKPKGTPDDHITTIVDIAEVFEIKDKAARAHKSQANDWNRFLKRMDHVDLKKEYFELIAENSLL